MIIKGKRQNRAVYSLTYRQSKITDKFEITKKQEKFILSII